MDKVNNLISDYTWFKTGGPSYNILKPTNVSDLQNFLKDNKDPYLVIGAGSNLIVSDEGFKGTVILTNRLRKIHLVSPNTIYAECGVLDLNLANYAANLNLTGLEFFTTIPGSVGGAIRMNAGCNKKTTADCLLEATYMTPTGEIKILSNEECGFTYRSSSVDKNWIILGGLFQVQEGNGTEAIKMVMDNMFTERAKKQPIGIPSVGCVFKNPLPHFAWDLIDKVGLRGYRHKTVMVSELHCNFVIHNDLQNAAPKSSDFIELVDIIKKKVLENYQIKLETEVVIVS